MSAKEVVYNPGHSLQGEKLGDKEVAASSRCIWRVAPLCLCVSLCVSLSSVWCLITPKKKHLIFRGLRLAYLRDRTRARLSPRLQRRSFHATNLIFNRGTSLMNLTTVAGTPESTLRLLLAEKINQPLKYLVSPSHVCSALIFWLLKTELDFSWKIWLQWFYRCLILDVQIQTMKQLLAMCCLYDPLVLISFKH